MNFVKKEWKDRETEFEGRRKLIDVQTLKEIVVDVTRAEGEVFESGDIVSASNMNNLEGRIERAFELLEDDSDFKLEETVNKYPYVLIDENDSIDKRQKRFWYLKVTGRETIVQATKEV